MDGKVRQLGVFPQESQAAWNWALAASFKKEEMLLLYLWENFMAKGSGIWDAMMRDKVVPHWSNANSTLILAGKGSRGVLVKTVWALCSPGDAR